MLSQITQICFNEPDYVTLHSIMNIMTENSAKNEAKHAAINGLKLLLSGTCQKRVITSTPCPCFSLVKLLCTYFCYLNLLNHG